MRKPAFLMISVWFLAAAVLPATAQDCAKAQELTVEANRLLKDDPALAEELATKALGLCEESASIHYNLGVIKRILGKSSEAKVYMEGALRRRSDFAKAHDALARIFVAEGNLDMALNHARRAVESEPLNAGYRETLEAARDVDVPPRTSAKLPDAVAVVIGNMSYTDPILSRAPVEYALKDASVMKDYLMQAMGFDPDNVIHLENARLIDFVKLFGDERNHRGQLFGRIRDGASVLFVYYSGHGAPDAGTKRAFIVPSDADPSVIGLTGYSVDTLNQNLGKVAVERNVRNVVLVMDACFSGGYNKGMIVPGASPIFIEVDEARVKGDRAAVISSSRRDQISSWYPEKKHGLFTYFFLKGIKDAAVDGRVLTAGDVEGYLRAPGRVGDFAWKLYNREQVPQVQGKRDVVLYRP